MTTYLKKVHYKNTEVNLFSAPWTRKGFSLKLNGVLEIPWFMLFYCNTRKCYFNFMRFFNKIVNFSILTL